MIIIIKFEAPCPAFFSCVLFLLEQPAKDVPACAGKGQVFTFPAQAGRIFLAEKEPLCFHCDVSDIDAL